LSNPECEKPATDEQICATYVRHHIQVYKKDKPHKFVYELLCCAVIWALVTGQKFTVGRRMITNSGKLKSLIWEQVAVL